MTEETVRFIKAGGATGTNGTITTETVTDGILSDEQSEQFHKQVFDKLTLSPMVRHEMHRAPNGKIDKIGIKEGIIRPFVENNPDDYNAQPNFGSVPYSVLEWWLPWSVTKKTIRDNIQGRSFEATVEDLMTSAMARDIERAAVNGDTSKTSGPFHEILSPKDGWIKQIKERGGHVVDGSSYDSLSMDAWGALIQELPSKYVAEDLTWLVNPRLAMQWALYLANNAVTMGGIVSDTFVKNPCGLRMIPVPSMPEDTIILTRPKNLILAHTFNVEIDKTDEGVTALRHNAIYYAVRFDMDYIIEEVDATSMMQGLPKTIYSHGPGSIAAKAAAKKG